MQFLDIGAIYAINATQHGERFIGDVWDLATCKTKFQALYTRKTQSEGWSDATFLKLRVFSAAFMNEMWKRCAFGLAATQLISVDNILLPNGKWLSNLDCVLPYGTTEGQGTFVWYPTNVSTQIVMDNANWLGDPKVRTLFRSPSYGNDTWVGGYHESFGFQNIRLTGGSGDYMDPSHKAYGLYIFDSGETGEVRKVYAEKFNTAGYAFERGTPSTADLLTAFNCGYAGIHLIGTALATMDFGTVSSDDCPAVYDMEAGGGREAGGVLNAKTTKLETGVTPESRAPWRGEMLAMVRGQAAVNFGAVSYAAAMIRTHAMIFVDARLTNGTPQNTIINIGAGKGFNYEYLVQDAMNKKMWKSPGNYAAFSALYQSANGGKLKVNDAAVNADKCNLQTRLGFLRGNTGAFDVVAGLPKYSYTSAQ